jgi:ABC-type branched-subunit amino acid transport system substrate-binding protein
VLFSPLERPHRGVAALFHRVNCPIIRAISRPQGKRQTIGEDAGMSVSNRKSGLSRRTLLKAGAAMGALTGALAAPRAFAQGAASLRVGFLTVNTGPLAAGGKQQEEGAALFLKERNGLIAGRKIELITQDTAGSPAMAKTKTQELVERHKVEVTIGPLATNEALAIDGYVRETKVPLITTTSAATVDL